MTTLRIILTLLTITTSLSSAMADSLPPTRSEMPVDPRHRLTIYMERLDSDRWLDREAATIDLARDRVVEENVIVERLAQSLMTQEQRLRLLRARETRLLLLPKGALGISMKKHISDFVDQDGQPVRCRGRGSHSGNAGRGCPPDRRCDGVDRGPTPRGAVPGRP